MVDDIGIDSWKKKQNYRGKSILILEDELLDYDKLSSIRLIRLVLYYADNKALETFFTRYNHIISLICKNGNQKSSFTVDYEEFDSFVKVWIFDNNKLKSLLKRYLLEKETDSIENDEDFVKGYLYRIFTSGFIAYLHEIRPEYRVEKTNDESSLIIQDSIIRHYIGEKNPVVEDRQPSIRLEEYNDDFSGIDRQSDLDQEAVDRKWDDAAIEKLLLHLDSLSHQSRIPLWLTYLVRLRDLPGKDVIWLAEVNDCTEEEVKEIIRDYVESNQGKSFCISSENIGKLMHEKKNTISVRKRRLLVKLQEIMADEMELL